MSNANSFNQYKFSNLRDSAKSRDTLDWHQQKNDILKSVKDYSPVQNLHENVSSLLSRHEKSNHELKSIHSAVSSNIVKINFDLKKIIKIFKTLKSY